MAHRSLRPTVIATATAQAKLFIELILNDQWRSLKQLKTEAAYATVGKLIAQYQRNAKMRTVHGDPNGLSASILTAELRLDS